MSILFLGIAFLSVNTAISLLIRSGIAWAIGTHLKHVLDYGRVFNQLYIACGTHYIWTSKIYFTFQMKFDSFVLIHRILFSLWLILFKKILSNMWLHSKWTQPECLTRQFLRTLTLGLKVEDSWGLSSGGYAVVHRLKFQTF